LFCFQPFVTNRSIDRLAMGTPALFIDLVEPDIQFTPTFPKSSVPYIPILPGNPGGSFADVKVIGNLFRPFNEGRNNEVCCKLFLTGTLKMYLVELEHYG